MKTPDTLICNCKENLRFFYEKHDGKIITKSIGDPIALFREGFYNYTCQIDIQTIPETFGLSLFQEMVEKQVELRIFYLHGEFYGSAIFSQSDPQTKSDFRNYNQKKPNRVVPYRITGNLKDQLHTLMEVNHLTSGSIDTILTPDNEYVFLEVNPVGQFEQVSIPCNYNLFKTIAEIL